MRQTIRHIVGIALSLLTLSCWAPEEFHATLNVDKTRRYQFVYEGTIVFAPALEEIKKSGGLPPDADRELQEAVLEMRNSPGFVNAEYVGRGRARVQFRESGVITSGKEVFLDLVKFNIDPAGRIRIQGADISLKDQQGMKNGGLKLDGTIRLTTSLTVVEHNATTTPWFGGLFGAYQWHVGIGQQQMPTILMQ